MSAATACGAALLSVSAMNVLRSQALPETDFRDPSQVLGTLNRAFQMKDQNNIYFTIWYGVFNRARRTLAFASGGHPPGPAADRRPAGSGLAADPRPDHRGPTGDPVPVRLPRPRPRQPSLRLQRWHLRGDPARTAAMLTFEEWAAMVARPAPGTPAVERLLREVQELHGSGSLEDDFSLIEVIFQ